MTMRIAAWIALIVALTGLAGCSWTFGSAISAAVTSNPDLECIENTIGGMDDMRVTSPWKRSDDGLMLLPKPFAKTYSYSLLYEAGDGFWGQVLVEMVDDKATDLYISQKFPVENTTSRGELTCTQEDHGYATRLMDEVYDRMKSVCDLRVNERGQSRNIHKSKRCPPRAS